MWHNVCIIENKILSIWQLRYHWWYRILSLQQLTVPSVITKISNWQSFVYRDWAQDWAQKNLSMIERLFYWQVYCHQRHWWQSRWQKFIFPIDKTRASNPCSLLNCNLASRCWFSKANQTPYKAGVTDKYFWICFWKFNLLYIFTRLVPNVQTYNLSALVPRMALCCLARSHYLRDPIWMTSITSSSHIQSNNYPKIIICIIILVWGDMIECLTLKWLGHFFQNVISFSDAVHCTCNIFIWNWSNTMNV